MTIEEWVDVILDKWVADEPVEYAHAIASLYSTADYDTISEVMGEVSEQQGDMIIEQFAEENGLELEEE